MVLASVIAPQFVRAEATPRDVRPATMYFGSFGQRIRIDRYPPAGGRDKHRNILVLHGAGGMLFDGPRMRRVARALSVRGYTAFLPHYFDETGTIFARTPAMMKNFERWCQTVRDAVDWVAQQHAAGRSASKVGVYGYSLGAFLAVAASSDNPKVGAVVEQAGGIWNNQSSRIGRLPRVLIIHGRADERVPFAKYCVPLQRALTKRGTPFEKRIFSSEGHVFSPAAAAAAAEEGARFFDRSPD